MNSKISFKKNTLYRNEIDGLRAIAVIAVIINHLNKEILPSGYLGVDIFFVISGYVITASLIRRKCNNFIDFISSFYERRIKRILPLLTLFVITISILICIFNVYPIFNLRTGITSLLGLSNIWLFKTSDGYFTPSSALDPFTHTWSLSVEEQFYFVYPLLAWFTGYSRNKIYGTKCLSILLSILSIFSLTLFIYFYEINQNAAYFLMPPRFWEMAIGCLVFIGIYRNYKIIEIFKKFKSNYFLILLVFSLFLPTSIGFLANIIAVALTSLVIICINKKDKSYIVLTNKYILKIGLMSYSLYLWHWGVISISSWTLGIYWWTIPFQVIIIFIVSFISYKYVEKPLRNIDFMSRFKSYIFGLILILFGQGIIIFLGTEGKRLLFAGNISGLYKRNLISKKIFLNECNLAREKFDVISKNINCSSINNFNHKRIIIVGDSHANMFFNPFKYIAKDNFEITNFSGNACSFPVLNDSSLNKSKNCFEGMKNAEIWIENNTNKGDIVFLANNTYYNKLLDYFSKQKKDEMDRTIYDYLINLNKFSAKLRNKGVMVNFFVYGPRFNGITDAYCSVEWYRPKSVLKENCYIKKAKFEEPRNKIINYLLLNKHKNIELIYDYLDLICDEKSCNASGYIDSNHIIEDLGVKIILKENIINNLNN